MNNPNTYFLISSLKKGNVKTFEKTYKAYYSKLHGFAKKFDSTTLQPEDFVQQTFLKLWDEKDQLREDILLDKQLFVICRNLILNHLLREKKLLTHQSHHINSYESPEEPVEMASTEEWDKLNRVIKKMPNKRREIFVLHKMENLTYEEIAGYLCLSKKTIANHIYLASNFLKEQLRNS